MDKAISDSRDIWQRLSMELEKEKHQIREDQMELKEQLQDFKDSNKYLVLVEDCNRERKKQEQKKNGTQPEKRIQNEARHYALKAAPEIKVNPAYFKRRSLEAERRLRLSAVSRPPKKQRWCQRCRRLPRSRHWRPLWMWVRKMNLNR